MRTVRVYPSFAGRLDGTPSEVWEGADKVLLPDGQLALIRIASGSSQTPFQYFVFETQIPSFAKIEAGRMVARMRVASGPAEQLRLARYQYYWEMPDGSEPPRWTNISPYLYPSGDWQEIAEPLSSMQIGLFNGRIGISGLPDSKAPLSIRNRFSVAMRMYRDEAPAETVTEIDYLAFEFDFTTPPMPWKGSIHIQGDPMTTQKIKQGANAPNISVSVTDATGAPLDLRGCKLSLVAKSQSAEFGGEVTITDAEGGRGEYSWQEGDTSVPGLYRVELVTEWLDGSKVVIPFDRYGLIEVVPSL